MKPKIGLNGIWIRRRNGHECFAPWKQVFFAVVYRKGSSLDRRHARTVYLQ